MGLPAARILDTFLCPLSSGATAHTGGTLNLGGASNVFIEKKPAAIQGTQGICSGTGVPNSVATGSSSVFINNRAAARQTDLMNHGGPIVMGASTVSIG